MSTYSHHSTPMECMPPSARIEHKQARVKHQPGYGRCMSLHVGIRSFKNVRLSKGAHLLRRRCYSAIGETHRVIEGMNNTAARKVGRVRTARGKIPSKMEGSNLDRTPSMSRSALCRRSSYSGTATVKHPSFVRHTPPEHGIFNNQNAEPCA